VDAVEEAYLAYDSVVLAKVVSVESGSFPLHPELKELLLSGEITTFALEHAWKGDPAVTFRTRIVTQCCFCGMSFVVGEHYLLYLTGPDDDGFYDTSSCSRSARSADAGDDIAVLEQKVRPNKSLEPTR